MGTAHEVRRPKHWVIEMQWVVLWKSFVGRKWKVLKMRMRTNHSGWLRLFQISLWTPQQVAFAREVRLRGQECKRLTKQLLWDRASLHILRWWLAGPLVCSEAGDALANNYSLKMGDLRDILPGALRFSYEYLTHVLFNFGNWSEIPKQLSFIKIVWWM